MKTKMSWITTALTAACTLCAGCTTGVDSSSTIGPPLGDVVSPSGTGMKSRVEFPPFSAESRAAFLVELAQYADGRVEKNVSYRHDMQDESDKLDGRATSLSFRSPYEFSKELQLGVDAMLHHDVYREQPNGAGGVEPVAIRSTGSAILTKLPDNKIRLELKNVKFEDGTTSTGVIEGSRTDTCSYWGISPEALAPNAPREPGGPRPRSVQDPNWTSEFCAAMKAEIGE